jgi:hypothetical protein
MIQGLDRKAATGTPRTRAFEKRAVGFVQVVPWDLRFSGVRTAAEKGHLEIKCLRESALGSFRHNLSWVFSLQRPGERKWDAPSKLPDFKVSVISTVASPRSSYSFLSSENTDLRNRPRLRHRCSRKDSNTLPHLPYA